MLSPVQYTTVDQKVLGLT